MFILVGIYSLNLWAMEEEKKAKKPTLTRQLSQVITTKLKPHHRRNKSVTTDSFENPALDELKADPIQDAEKALFEGNNNDFQKSLTLLQDCEQFQLCYQLKVRWIVMRRKKIQNDPFNTENHGNGSKISYLTRQQYNKIETP